MLTSIGVIGFGRMAQAILSPLLKSGKYSPSQLFGVVGNSKTGDHFLIDEFTSKVKVVSSEDPLSKQVWDSPVILLAVKPQQLLKVANYSRHSNKDSTKPLLISILAGITLERLSATFPGHNCVRAVPNTPCLVGEGLTALSFMEGVEESQRSTAYNFFNLISEVIELPESQLDAFLSLSSSGPAYVSLIVEALADGAVASGLPRELAYHLSNKMIAGTVSLLKKQQLHPAELKDMVSSPSGTTISAIRHLEMVGLRSALIEAVVLAAERSRELR